MDRAPIEEIKKAQKTPAAHEGSGFAVAQTVAVSHI
jgi:hypothetical protein